MKLNKYMEDLIYGLIGLGMIYVWIHTIVVCFKKLNKLTQYEKVICWISLVTLVLYVIGSLQ